MANLETWKRGSMTNVIGEATRELDEYKNNVVEERRHLNYNLIEGSDTRADILAKINKRVHDVMGDRIKPQTRRNMKPLGTWVVTLPQELNGLSDDEKREFFETALEFVGERYGKENLMYAAVHNDENQPHMHVGVVPVCISRKTKKETVSSASKFTKKDLATFHDDLDALMAEKYGQKGLMRNGRTKGNYTLDELKERTRVENELANKQKEIALVQKQLMETVWPTVKQIKEEKPRLEAQRLKNESDAKRNDEREEQLLTWETQLSAREAQLSTREAQLATWEEVLNEREEKVNEKGREASEKLSEAVEKLEEVKATESRIKALLDEIKEHSVALVENVRNVVSKWAGRVRRLNHEPMTNYYDERTEKLVDDIEEDATKDNFAHLTLTDLDFYDDDMQDAFDDLSL